MKIQDLLFLIVLIMLLIKRNEKMASSAGLISLLFSIPLFAMWVFFTAERLIWYAAVFFLLAIILQVLNLKKRS